MAAMRAAQMVHQMVEHLVDWWVVLMEYLIAAAKVLMRAAPTVGRMVAKWEEIRAGLKVLQMADYLAVSSAYHLALSQVVWKGKLSVDNSACLWVALKVNLSAARMVVMKDLCEVFPKD
jgi:hypothetical protein